MATTAKPHREEVRRASDNSAHPRMRIALERALAGELDDATVEALAEAAAAEEEALARGKKIPAMERHGTEAPARALDPPLREPGRVHADRTGPLRRVRVR
jgi:hypothetical protein